VRVNVEQLNAGAEVLQFSENTAIDNKRIEDVSSAPIPTKKDNEVTRCDCLWKHRSFGLTRCGRMAN
jgi:hypothetical protein